MKLGIITVVGILFATAPVFADEAEFISYSIKIDKDQDYEKMLEKNKEIFEKLEGTYLFSRWLKEEKSIPNNAKDVYTKPAFSVNVGERSKETDYIKCEKNTSIK